MTYVDHWLVALAVVLLVGANECTPAHADPTWTEQEVLIARLAVHEASGRDDDTVAIAEARGGYSVERLRADHPRALAETMSGPRRWIADLDADAHEPEGWPAHRLSWTSVGRPMWLRTLTVVRATLRGVLGCRGGRADVWGGASLDRERIERIVAHGGEVVDCGHTANVYLRLGGGR